MLSPRSLALALLTIMSFVGVLVAGKSKPAQNSPGGNRPNCNSASLTINPDDTDDEGGVDQKQVYLCEDQTVEWRGKNFEVVFEGEPPFKNGIKKFATTQPDTVETIGPCKSNAQNCGANHVDKQDDHKYEILICTSAPDQDCEGNPKRKFDPHIILMPPSH